MFAFTEYPNFIEAGTQVNVQALGINDVGATNFTPQGNTSSFFVKSVPLIPFPVQIEIVSNNTAAKLTWRALKDRNAGFDPIISYSFVMGVYDET
jgi:hypothetical protein